MVEPTGKQEPEEKQNPYLKNKKKMLTYRD